MQVRFLGAAKCSSGKTANGCKKNKKQQLVIEERAFAECAGLRQVVFEPGSAVTEIQSNAFWRSGLESFVAPPSLKKIGALAFRDCRNLKRFELNNGIQELGWFCLWGFEITDLRLPLHIRMTRK